MRTKVLVSLLAVSAVACGKKNGNDSGCTGCSGGGMSALKPAVDLAGAAGLLVVDPGSGGASLALEEHNRRIQSLKLSGAHLLSEDDKKLFLNSSFNAQSSADADASTGGEKSLQKTDSSGNVTSAISVPTPEAGDQSQNQNQFHQEPLPKISTIAVSPKHEVFIHFEHPFLHKTPTDTNGGGDWSDGNHCQIFKVKGGTVEDLKNAAPSADNLECLTYDHQINNWGGSRLSVFQFDDAGNVYFPGQVANSPKTVVYKYDRETGALTEMINSNICVQDFLVTKSGGLFYTGTSSCNGGGSSGGGFFRYVAPASSGNGAITEIARDWWNFIYEPVSTATSDKAVFFGPDPREASSASWNSACVFNFDPAGGDTTADRTTPVITCGGDIWSWVQMRRSVDIKTYGKGFQDGNDASDAYKTEFKHRCESEGDVFAGGGSQITAIKQDSTGQIYLIGNLRKKNKGTLSCSVEVRGPHCKVTDGPITDSGYDTESGCVAKGGTWVDEGNCFSYTGGTLPTTASACFTASGTWGRKSTWYSGVKTSMCTATGAISQANWWDSDNTKSFQNATSAGTNVLKFRLNQFDCQPPESNGGGDSWTSEYKALAKVNSDTGTLTLLSDTKEQAINLWLINDKVYYASYNTEQGKYLLNQYTSSGVENMATNFEIYNLSEGPDSTKLYFDGLDFSNNSYTFGTMTNTSPYTKEQKTGLTGTLKTIVILPKN